MSAKNCQFGRHGAGDMFVIVLNFGNSKEVVNLRRIFKKSVPKEMRVVVASVQSTHPVARLVHSI